MEGRKIIDQAEKLLKQNAFNDSKQLLLSEGYVRRLNEEIQKAFIRLIPESEIFLNVKKEHLDDLFNKDDKVKLSTARYVFKEARKEFSWKRSEWLGDPRMVDILLKIINPISNSKLTIEVTGAFWMISERYLKDLRIYEFLVSSLNHKNKHVVIYASYGLYNYSIDEKWNDLLNKLEQNNDIDITKAILGNIYIKSEMGVFGEISEERVCNITDRLNYICDKKDENIKEEIINTLKWIEINLAS